MRLRRLCSHYKLVCRSNFKWHTIKCTFFCFVLLVSCPLRIAFALHTAHTIFTRFCDRRAVCSCCAFLSFNFLFLLFFFLAEAKEKTKVLEINWINDIILWKCIWRPRGSIPSNIANDAQIGKSDAAQPTLSARTRVLLRHEFFYLHSGKRRAQAKWMDVRKTNAEVPEPRELFIITIATLATTPPTRQTHTHTQNVHRVATNMLKHLAYILE